jgi:peptidoglycan/xylan/chitin deacetylase (PgdA/CDA1 family)
LPKLLDALDGAGVSTTCFSTGEVAERHPDRITDIIARGHELGCHGHTHRRFDRMDDADAQREIFESTTVLRAFGAEVTSFRAPNLKLPERYVPLLEAAGYVNDSSLAKYKAEYYAPRSSTALRRIPASITSSALRLPRWVRDPMLLALRTPVVLFVHPWEFVDLTRERLRLDCRFRTGEPALRALLDVIALFRSRDARFVRLRDVGNSARAKAA